MDVRRSYGPLTPRVKALLVLKTNHPKGHHVQSTLDDRTCRAIPTNLGIRLKIVTCLGVDMNKSMCTVGISRSTAFTTDAIYGNKSRGLPDCRVRPSS